MTAAGSKGQQVSHPLLPSCGNPDRRAASEEMKACEPGERTGDDLREERARPAAAGDAPLTAVEAARSVRPTNG